MRDMHVWDDHTELFAHSVIGYAIERLQLPKNTRWGQHPAVELAADLEGAISADGRGGVAALHLFRDVILPACRPNDDPMHLAYVGTAPSIAATMFDLVLSTSSVFAGLWEAGAGAIAAENQALRWLADLAGFPSTAGGVFLPGGSAANLTALVAARQAYEARHGRPTRYRFAATSDVHASVGVAARVMDVEVLDVDVDGLGRMTAATLSAALDRNDTDGLFAVVATSGTTNSGAIDDLPGVADVCAERGVWLHVDGAYGASALACPQGRQLLVGIERADSFGIDPHKWLFAPYDCAALVYRDPTPAGEVYAQHGAYLDAVDRGEWNPADYAYQLTRRARGLPLWFSLVTYGTEAYAAAVQHTIDVAHAFAAEVDRRDEFTLVREPSLSVVLFTRDGWTRHDYLTWSRVRALDGTCLMVPTTWHGEPCMRICLVHPRTELTKLVALLDDLATFDPSAP